MYDDVFITLCAGIYSRHGCWFVEFLGCQIKKTGENLSAVFTINDTEMTVKEIKKESDTYKCNFYVDGTYVSLTFIQEGKNKLTGKANAEGMVIPVTFTKIVKAVQAR